MDTYELEEKMFIDRFCNIYETMSPKERNIVIASNAKMVKDKSKSKDYYKALAVYRRVYGREKPFREIALEMSEKYNDNITETKVKYYYRNAMRKIFSYLNRNEDIQEELRNYLLFMD